MAKTTNIELYEKSLKRIYSLSTRQLNMAYITWSYMLMGYEIESVDESLHTFTMVNRNLTGPEALKMINYSASKTVNLRANLIMLQQDIDKFYKRQVEKGMSATVLGKFLYKTEIDDVTKYNDILKNTAKWLYGYNQLSHATNEHIIKSLQMKEEMNNKYVGHRILELISDVYNVNSKHMETLLSHNTKARPDRLIKTGENKYSYIYDGVPAVIAATSEEEAEAKINQHYIDSSLRKWYRQNEVIALETDDNIPATTEGAPNEILYGKATNNNRGQENNSVQKGSSEEHNSPYPIKVEQHGAYINDKNEMVYDENRGQQYFDFFSDTHEQSGK